MPASSLTLILLATGSCEALYFLQLLKNVLRVFVPTPSFAESRLRILAGLFFMAAISSCLSSSSSLALNTLRTSVQEWIVVEQLICPPRKNETSPLSLNNGET
jgi:hypothetical protein